jgi:hypothetical protein
MQQPSPLPEGKHSHCPLCGNAICTDASRPPGDGHCLCCGSPLSFAAQPAVDPVPDAIESWPACPSAARSGPRARINDGVFAGMEGWLTATDSARGLVRVELTVRGRPVPVELETWQVDLLP